LAKIARILDTLDAVTSENDIKALGSGIHQLSGNMKYMRERESVVVKN